MVQKTIFELYIEVLKKQNPKMEADSLFLIANRELLSRTQSEMAKILNMSELKYRELESGTHGFNAKFTKLDYAKIFNFTEGEIKIWFNLN